MVAFTNLVGSHLAYNGQMLYNYKLGQKFSAILKQLQKVFSLKIMQTPLFVWMLDYFLCINVTVTLYYIYVYGMHLRS